MNIIQTLFTKRMGFNMIIDDSLSLVSPSLHLFLKSNFVFLMYQRPDQSVPVDPLQETITMLAQNEAPILKAETYRLDNFTACRTRNPATYTHKIS